MLFSEEINNMCSNNIADIIDRDQLLMCGRHNAIQKAKITGEIIGSHHAHLANTERINKTSKRSLFRLLQCIQYILSTFFCHTLKAGNLIDRQMKQIIKGIN